MTRFAVLALVAGLATAAVGSPVERRPSLVFLGDSLTAGALTTDTYDPDGGFVGRIARLIGDRVRVEQRGLGGATTLTWLTTKHTYLVTWVWREFTHFPRGWNETFVEFVLRFEAPVDVVVILLGTNDLQLDVAAWPDEALPVLTRYIDQLAEIHAQAAAGATRVFVATVPPAAATPDGLTQAANDYIRNRFPNVIPTADAMRAAGGITLLGDGIHPTAAGYDVLARTIIQALTRERIVTLTADEWRTLSSR